MGAVKFRRSGIPAAEGLRRRRRVTGKEPEGDWTVTLAGAARAPWGSPRVQAASAPDGRAADIGGPQRHMAGRWSVARQVTGGAGSVRPAGPLRQTRHRPRPAQSHRHRAPNRARHGPRGVSPRRGFQSSTHRREPSMECSARLVELCPVSLPGGALQPLATGARSTAGAPAPKPPAVTPPTPPGGATSAAAAVASPDAERQRRYRQRRRANVTHQGSPPAGRRRDSPRSRGGRSPGTRCPCRTRPWHPLPLLRTRVSGVSARHHAAAPPHSRGHRLATAAGRTGEYCLSPPRAGRTVRRSRL